MSASAQLNLATFAPLFAKHAKQEEYCEQLEGDMGAELKRMMLGLEVRRVRYLLKAYHRTRLLKVERFAATIMDNDDLRTRLSA